MRGKREREREREREKEREAERDTQGEISSHVGRCLGSRAIFYDWMTRKNSRNGAVVV